MTGQELKYRILDRKNHVLCDKCFFRYCPTYECSLVDKAKALTDRQWDNIAKNINSELDFCEVPYEIMKRRIKNGKQN